MATLKTEPEQPQHASNPNLDMLQGMLNMVLLTAGRFIKEHQAGGGTGLMKQGMQRAVPAATERFHDALDELENEVRLAQAVLRRDLALLKQDRKKREAAAKQQEAERVRLAAESRASVPAKVEEVAVKPENVTPAALPRAESPIEPPIKADSPDAPPVTKVEDDAAPPATATDTAAAPPTDPLFDATPTASDHQEHEFDFDFEFGDAMDTSGNDNPGDTMDTSGDMDFNLDEGPSLLRGLEDFAKSSDDDKNNNSNGPSTTMDLDLPMPDLPGLDSETKSPTEPPKPADPPKPTEPTEPTEPVPQPAPQPPPPADATKDTKPVEEATKPPTDTETTSFDEPMETMTTDNLEDLFNLDDYDDAEGGDSAFNDAFFNFD